MISVCQDFLQYGTKSKKYRHFTNNKVNHFTFSRIKWIITLFRLLVWIRKIMKYKKFAAKGEYKSFIRFR